MREVWGELDHYTRFTGFDMTINKRIVLIDVKPNANSIAVSILPVRDWLTFSEAMLSKAENCQVCFLA
ncbi:MAG TPA: hypothetical protein PLW39_09710 [Thermoflexales bacterium]|nr:hypothetical protein [Thermoflexales bacterium]